MRRRSARTAPRQRTAAGSKPPCPQRGDLDRAFEAAAFRLAVGGFCRPSSRRRRGSTSS